MTIIKKALSELGISSSELATRIGEDKGFVSKLVNGKRSCSARVIRNIYIALESTVSYAELVDFFADYLEAKPGRRGRRAAA